MGRNNAAACYRELGAEMKKRREMAGLTGAQVGRRTGWSATKLSRLESGRLNISVADLVWFLGICGVPYEVAVPLIDLCREAANSRGYWIAPRGERVPDAFSSLIYHETTANLSTSYESQLIPGLLQTERYARTVISRNTTYDKAEVGSSLRIRIDRQRVLNHRDRRFTFYVHEQALRTVVGDGDVMYEQLLALALSAGAPNVVVRVVTGSIGDDPALAGSFRIFEFQEHQPLVYLDSTVASFWLEDTEYVAPYGDLALHLAEVAEGVEESRSLIAAMADDYDRGSSAHAAHRVAEE